ncbi:hypothetical protein [Streptomyces phaeochromogenes]|uniref:Uncharacterized protein n=1 Tax=Streptomyces phaeochromogenes TaxID=1923 RepID=A0ABZ1HCB5_STRPH|nr:hypothetical protein [Streptomyces phaeochromogenes]MCX5601683.1 hypothetical protein [Streptomyces phaeochromogenes]WRZ29477.1 hypothetical protein OG931_17815 [Streptomyces phaeochromogenes]WSD15212.1 hypothetical protein OHB35_19260 [Streptomyces phaeochromogenes]WSJ07959.1 hypothetical protein OG437_32155 [Streptomyces phaeochromogenes]WSS93735.1 hypothetical protein OG478_19365 [Streptomyces phaeochromogenes]
METTQLEGLISMLFVLGILVLLVLPSAFGIVRDRRIDRQLREAEQGHRKDQKSSSKPTEPSTATWYAEGRRSKKLVSS